MNADSFGSVHFTVGAGFLASNNLNGLAAELAECRDSST